VKDFDVDLGVAQVVECFSSKHEALNSIPNTALPTKKRENELPTVMIITQKIANNNNYLPLFHLNS
jgi:hypothetical protein